MAGTADSISTHNSLVGSLNSSNVIAAGVGTAYNPTYALVSETGAQIALFISSSDYKLYAQLKDKSGNLIYTSNIIDLPIESMVVDGRYDEDTKKLILVLDNGNEIEVPLGALINGLVSTDDLSAALANYYTETEIDALLNGYWKKTELTQEDIDNWNAKQEYLNQGDNIKISAETELGGNTYQYSTSGKQLIEPKLPTTSYNGITCTKNENGTYTLNGTASGNATFRIDQSTINGVDNLKTYNGTYTMFCNELVSGITIDLMQNATWELGMRIHASNKMTTSVLNLSDCFIYVEVQSGVQLQNLTIKPMLESGSTATEWEEYTGGIASPNPDYPQDIQVVSGDNTIKVEGKNLFDKDTMPLSNGLWISGDKIGGNSAGWYVVAPIIGGNTYTISRKNLGLLFATTTANIPANNVPIIDSWQGASSNKKELTIETTVGANYMFIAVFAGTPTDTQKQECIEELQLELGSSSTTYEPYTSQTYPINLPVENLWNSELNQGALSFTNGTPIASTKYVYNLTPIPVKAGETYTISAKDYTPDVDSGFVFFNNGTFVSGQPTTNNTITIPSGVNQLYYDFHRAPSLSPSDLEEIQLEKGTKANHYTEYGTTPIELCKIGTYQDYIRKSTGKNLFDKSTALDGYIVASTGVITTGEVNFKYEYIKVKPNTTYTISGITTTNTTIGASEYTSNKTFIRSARDYTNGSFTTSSTTEYVGVSVRTAELNFWQLEEGSSSTLYEPYGKVWYLHKEIGKVVLNGTEEGWTYDSTRQRFYKEISDMVNSTDSTQQIYTNYYRYVDFGETSPNGGCFSYYRRVYLYNYSYSTTTDLQTWLSTHNTTVYYALATPEATEITDSTLISQLNALSAGLSSNWIKNIIQTNNDLPFEIEYDNKKLIISADLTDYYTKSEINTLLGNKEDKSNKVATISASSTDIEYPTAKCVYNIIGDIESLLEALDIGSGV